MKNGKFYSKGKLLLSGEYAVLHGAHALALPLKAGQQMTVEKNREKDVLKWETFVMGEKWFFATFSLKEFVIVDCSDEKIALFISKLLQECSKLCPELQSSDKGYIIRNDIGFDIRWGLGSSSSLVSNLATWTGVDLWTLYRTTFHGSGYDVFCARADGPIIYRLKDNMPEVTPVRFRPSFAKGLFFVYLGRKQDSQQSVGQFKAKERISDRLIGEISGLTHSFAASSTLIEFAALMRDHEELMSDILGLPMVKQLYFSDFNGEIKSLGAWGGDFVMVASEMPASRVRDYFRAKGMPIVFEYEQLVL